MQKDRNGGQIGKGYYKKRLLNAAAVQQPYQQQNSIDVQLINNSSGPHSLGITNRLLQLGMQFQQVQESDVKLKSQVLSQKYSQIISEAQYGPTNPMIFSNIHNLNQNKINKLALLKFRNQISELKQIKNDLNDYIEDQKNIIKDFIVMAQLKMQDLLIKMKQQTVSINNTKIQQLNIVILNLKEQIKIKDKQMQQNKKQYILKQNQFLNTLSNLQVKCKDKNQKQSNNKNICFKCTKMKNQQNKYLDIINSLKEQISTKNEQNQRLQQYLFDLQQKVVGIDLQVEKKINQYIQLQKKREQKQSKLNNTNEQQLRKIKQKYEQLINQYQIKQNEIQKQLRIIQQRQQNIIILQNQYKIIKQQLQQKQKQLGLFQEKLYFKQNQINNKQHQISIRQTELMKKLKNTQQINNNMNNIINRSEELTQRNNKQLQKSFELSSKLKKIIPSYQTSIIKNQNSSINFQPQSTISKFQSGSFKINRPSKQFKQKSYQKSVYNSFYHQRPSKINTSIYHQPLKRNNSRVLERQDINGIGTKLSKLRQQIKKQIQSIK